MAPNAHGPNWWPTLALEQYHAADSTAHETEDAMKTDQILRLLRIMADHDMQTDDGLYWNSDLQFFAMCNDVFAWGCADLEPIETDVDLDMLEKCFEDASYWGFELYAARRRGVRPQGAAYPRDKGLWPLFDACGPERETNIANPAPHPSEATST